MVKGLSLHVHGPSVSPLLGTHPHVWNCLFTCLSLVDWRALGDDGIMNQ